MTSRPWLIRPPRPVIDCGIMWNHGCDPSSSVREVSACAVSKIFFFYLEQSRPLFFFFFKSKTKRLVEKEEIAFKVFDRELLLPFPPLMPLMLGEKRFPTTDGLAWRRMLSVIPAQGQGQRFHSSSDYCILHFLTIIFSCYDSVLGMQRNFGRL